MNIMQYLEKKRQKYNYNPENTKYYYNYIKNLSKFNKMESYKIYFVTELLLIDILKEIRRKFLCKKLNKIRKILKKEELEASKNTTQERIKNEEREIYFNYVKLQYFYKKREFHKTHELLKNIKTDFILFDSFLSELKFIEITCCNELNIKSQSNIINKPWNGINLVFESQLEMELFDKNKPLKGTSYERTINNKVNKVNLAIKKANKIIKKFLYVPTCNIKKIINKLFGWKDINNSIIELKNFLDDNLCLTEEFMQFYEAITSINVEIQNYLKTENHPFKEIDYKKFFPQIEDLQLLFKRLGKNDIMNFNNFQISLKEQINAAIKNQKHVIPNVPEFYDLANDFIDEISDETSNQLEENLDSLKITNQ